MRIVVKLVLFAAFVACVAWVIMKPGFDSVTAAIVSLATLLGAFIADKKAEATQSQKVGANSTAYQAGRDVKIRK
ncbi:hypothetical protein PMI27_004592 [Pseudomonas sp. GM41(2012)]|jgi:hypothetical protein|uniref:hypothetical protein n=1 Tax=Pseudomonas sp. (strain GM41(2012)) TaxID=1144708 RepID=UPI00027053BC|nr:hypothetical protein [Pseudomonas sp. GM41(2012)]EUB72670.1 hypothetical protein PMI27_004592 [Pseudomonas sp. GM41(2012)]